MNMKAYRTGVLALLAPAALWLGAGAAMAQEPTGKEPQARLAGAASAGGRAAEIRTVATEPRSGEQLETIPITRRSWERPQAVMSLGPGRIGALRTGDRIEAGFDLEVSVCLRPNPLHPGSGHPCPGKMYAFNPHLKAQAVLAPAADVANPDKVFAVGPVVDLQCSQKSRARNHHCVLQTPFKGAKIAAADKLPCAVGDCYLNVIISAHHPQARQDGGNKVTIGSTNNAGRIQQGKAKLAAAIFPGGKNSPIKTWRRTEVVSGRIPVQPDGRDVKKKVLLSQRISGLKKWDQLLIDAQLRTSINRLPYDAFQRTEVILAKTKNSTKHYDRPVETSARLSTSNGFNCTRKRSGHTSPCVLHKAGILSFKRNVSGPLFINVIAGQNAKGPSTWTRKWRSGQNAKVLRAGSGIKTRRFRGTSSCDRCATGWLDFSPSVVPAGSKHIKLVAQLRSDGIDRGRFTCSWRGKPSVYTCDWYAKGRFGQAPRYQCDLKAWWRKGHWDVKFCKDAFESALWDRLQQRGQNPIYTGSCKEISGGRIRCNWSARDETSCGGTGTWTRSKRTWALSPRCK